MSITNEQKQKYLEQRRYFYAASPSRFAKKASSQKKKETEEEQNRQKKLLSYLKQTKASAIKRGMYRQNPYNKMVSEAQNNV